MRVIIAIISFLKQMWWPVLIAGRLWSVQQHRQNKKISKTAQTRIYGWTKHRRSFNIRDVAHVEYLYAIPKKMPMNSIVMGISHVAFSSISLGVNSGGKTAPSFQSMGVKRG